APRQSICTWSRIMPIPGRSRERSVRLRPEDCGCLRLPNHHITPDSSSEPGFQSFWNCHCTIHLSRIAAILAEHSYTVRQPGMSRNNNHGIATLVPYTFLHF